MAIGRPIKQQAKTRVAEVLIFLMTSGYDGCAYNWLEVSHGTGIPRSWLDNVQTGRVTDPPLSRVLTLSRFFHVPLVGLAAVLADENLSLREHLVSTISMEEAQALYRTLRQEMWMENEECEERERLEMLAARRKRFGIDEL